VSTTEPRAPLVRTSSGALRGEACAGGACFRGVPYAAPPIGSRRFRPPERHEPWDGVRDALTAAAPLPQPTRAMPGLRSELILGPGWDGSSPELTLNIWTPEPARGARCPVLVFAHCGAFIAGTANTALYDGAAFARDGVVCVTVEYRLGGEGFVAFEDGTANLGLHDLLAALRWVQEEIAAFGGDPSRVTVAGQSAGAMSIGLALGGPAGRGLASRAISQSGGVDLTFDMEEAQRLTLALAAALGVPARRAAFAEVPNERLVQAAASLTPGSVDLGDERHPGGGIITFLPVRDGVTVAEDPRSGLATAGLDALMAGTTADEAHIFLAGRPAPENDAAAWDEAVQLVAGIDDDPRHVLEQARSGRPQGTLRELASGLISETLFGAPTRGLVHAHVATGTRTYAYEFAWRSPALGERLGACHCVELPAVFSTDHEPDLLRADGLLGETGYPAGLTKYTHDAWVSFVKDGDPGWLPVTGDGYRYQRIGATADLVTPS